MYYFLFLFLVEKEIINGEKEFMKKKLSIELQENLIRFILSSHRKNKLEILEILETDYELETVEEEKQEIPVTEDEVPKEGIEKAVAKIQEVIKKKKWNKLKKNLLYTVGDLMHLNLELPLVPDDEMEDAVKRKLIGEKLLKEEDEVAFDAIGASDSKGLYGVYVQVIPKELLSKLQPLKLQGIDFEVFAINRKQVSYTNPKESTIFLDIGRKKTTITIYHREHLGLYRSINTGTEDIIGEISRILGIDIEEAKDLYRRYGYVSSAKGSQLMDEGEMRGMDLAEACGNIMSKVERKVFQYMDYFQFRHTGEALKTLYYKVDDSSGNHFEDFLKTTFYLEHVFPYNHLLGTDAERVEEGIPSEWSILLGTVESKHGVKFIGKSFKLPFKAKKNPIYIAIGIIFIMFMGMRYGYYKLQEIDQMMRLTSISERQKVIEKDLEEYRSLENKIRDLKKDISYLSGITGKNTIFNNFLSDLSYEVGSQIYLDDVSYSGDKVSLRGRAISGTEYAEVYINEMVRNIEKISEEVRLVKTTKLSRNRNVNDFLIEVTLSGGEMSGK